MSSDLELHWSAVYGGKPAEALSWFQPHAKTSMELTRQALPDRSARILDVGGGASSYADDLLAEGYRRVFVLDLARAALDIARRRLGTRARQVGWVAGDALNLPCRNTSVDLWHDRAVFHFFTAPGQHARYVEQVRRTLRPGGYLLVATFAGDAPPRCSGLPVARYDPDQLQQGLGAGFELVTSRREVHQTPGGVAQPFTYGLFQLISSPR